MTAGLRSVLAVLGGYLTMATVVMLFTGASKCSFPLGFPRNRCLRVPISLSILRTVSSGLSGAAISLRGLLRGWPYSVLSL